MAIALAAGISGCGGDKLTLPGDATPTKIEMVTGDAQAGIVGSALPLPLIVKVTDELGRPVVNQNVTFTVESGGGQVAPGSSATGSDGRASATWTLGPDAGAQQVQAQAVGGGAPDNLVVAFGATAVAGSGSLIAAVSGNDQSAAVNSALPDSLVVKVSDGSNNPVSGITVQWTAVGGGSVSPADSRDRRRWARRHRSCARSHQWPAIRAGCRRWARRLTGHLHPYRARLQPHDAHHSCRGAGRRHRPDSRSPKISWSRSPMTTAMG